MRAVMLRRFGLPDALAVEEVPDPLPGPGQVLVRVEAASVVFIDTHIRAGKGQIPAHQPDLPAIPGNGVGGRVIAAGDGADPALVGTRVVSTTGGRGGYAELVAVDPADVVPVPDGLDMLTATALMADGRTAMLLTRLAGPAAGEWALVEAAGGGLGILLVQLARNAGARVIGAASSPEKRAAAADVGAEVTVDYTRPDWTDRVREVTGGTGPDVLYDGVGGEVGLTAFGVVRDGGRFVVHGMAGGSLTRPPEDEVERRNVRVLGLWSGSDVSLQELTRLAFAEAAGGRLRPVIGQILPLEQAAAAHAAIEGRSAVGKTLLVPSAAD